MIQIAHQGSDDSVSADGASRGFDRENRRIRGYRLMAPRVLLNGNLKVNPSVFTRDQVRQFDRIANEVFGINSLVLMENAARGATDVLCSASNVDERRALILCGPGNNGGDGLVMARHLHIRGWQVEVGLLASADNLSPDSQANLAVIAKTRIKVFHVQITDGNSLALERNLDDFDWIVDAMLGTGAKPPLRSPYPEIIDCVNQANTRRFAVDLPTGLECDDAIGSSCGNGVVFSAERTATFVSQKPVMLTTGGKKACGQITIVDIGAPPEVFELIDFSDRKPNR